MSQTKIRNAISQGKALLGNVLFSAGVSWQASPPCFLYRVFSNLTGALFPTVLVFLNKSIIDTLAALSGTSLEDKTALYPFATLLIVYIAIKLLEIILGKISEVLTGMHQDLISKNINMKLMNQTNRLDLSYFDSPRFYDESLNANVDSSAIPVLSWTVVSLVGCIVQLVVSSTVMMDYNIWFWLMLVALSVPSVLVERKFTERIYNWSRERAPEERKMNYTMYIATDRQYAKDVRVYNIYQNMRERYLGLWNKWYTEKKNWTVKHSVFLTAVSLLPEIGLVIVTIFVSMNIIEQKLTIGDFSLYTGMAVQLVSSVWAVINVAIQIYENDMRISNFRRFLSREPMIKDEGSLKPAQFPKIEFRDVSFRYPYTERDIFRNVSFVIQPKEKIALVGVNGAGKTTLIKLLLRFYDVSSGEILLDDINIKEYSIKELRKAFGVMFQDFTSYAFTARENITISDLENADNLESFDRAASISGVDQLSKKWEKGYDTYLTKQFDETGEELSGGEWQKIALARAFFHDAGIVILDEPNAAMDPESEHRIFELYSKLLKESGAILISHRLSNVLMADRVLVIEDGTIIESGSHEDLMKKNGRYAYLFHLQSDKYIGRNL